MADFNEEDCYVPIPFCGEGDVLPKGKKNDTYYHRLGTRYECLKQGIGVGIHTEKRKDLPKNSLQQIKYIGEKLEGNFVKAGIRDITSLLREAGKKTSTQIESMLRPILKRKNGVIDERAYNSVVLYLYRHGIANVPKCKKIRV
jgi:hypothetical protein